MNIYHLDDIPEDLREYFQPAPQIGLESSPEQFVAKLVEVFREVRRVLRDDGTCWLNLGDSYNGSQQTGGTNSISGTGKSQPHGGLAKRCDGLKPKDLVGIPWRVAFALQADGWWLRQDIIWAKPNPMPESVTDRCTKAHEYLFLLTKSDRYYYDAEAVREDSSPSTEDRYKYAFAGQKREAIREQGIRIRGTPDSFKYRAGRNRRSVWTVATAPYSEAHFATYPPKLIEPCILAGTSEKGACSVCGAPWERVVERTDQLDESAKGSRFDHGKTGKRTGGDRTQTGLRFIKQPTGWQPSCDCNADVVPCVVFDPFGGSGTTAGVANALGRDAILCELNPEYANLIPARVKSIVDDYHGRKPTSTTKPAKGQRELFK